MAVLISDFNYMVIVAKRRKKKNATSQVLCFLSFLAKELYKYKEVERVPLCGGWQPVLRFIVTTYYDKYYQQDLNIIFFKYHGYIFITHI